MSFISFMSEGFMFERCTQQRTRRCMRRGALMMACTLPVFCAAKDLAPNTGNIDLVGNITMQVQISQQGGACGSDYAWHATYGGCRRAVAEEQQQRESCGADYTGEQVRARVRTQYVLQSTGQAANDPWGAWSAWDRSACVAVASRIPGVLPELITLVWGSVARLTGYRNPTRQASPMHLSGRDRGYNRSGSTYAVTLDRTTAQLRCVFAIAYTDMGESAVWMEQYAWLLGVGESLHTEHGHCQLSQDKMQAQIFGNCDRMVGAGDWERCQHGAQTVSILAVRPCSATVQVQNTAYTRYPQPPTEHEYPLCS